MRQWSTSLIAALAASATSTAHAATTYAQAFDMPAQNNAAYGAAFSHSTGRGDAHASAFEFRRGVAVTAQVAGFGDLVEHRLTSGGAASATATSSDTFFVNIDTPGLFALDGGFFVLGYSIVSGGTVEAARVAAPNSDPFGSDAAAGYSYQWSVGGPNGGESVIGDRGLSLERGGETRNFGRGGDETSALLFVKKPGDAIHVSWYATASANCSGTAPCTALADFGHTLRWGGVTSLSYIDSFGVEQDLPSGFRLSLMSEDGLSIT